MSNRSKSSVFGGGVASVFSAASDYLSRRRTYRQTLRELNALSDRELSDVGINKSVIGALARQSAGFLYDRGYIELPCGVLLPYVAGMSGGNPPTDRTASFPP